MTCPSSEQMPCELARSAVIEVGVVRQSRNRRAVQVSRYIVVGECAVNRENRLVRTAKNLIFTLIAEAVNPRFEVALRPGSAQWVFLWHVQADRLFVDFQVRHELELAFAVPLHHVAEEGDFLQRV